MTKMQIVKLEFGESFFEVVKGMAEQGQSKSTVCSALGFHTKQFWYQLDRMNLHQYFKPQKDQMKASRPGNKKAKGNGLKGCSLIKNRKPIHKDGIMHMPGTDSHNLLYDQMKSSQRWRNQTR